MDERANFSCVVADSSVHWRVNETDVDDLPGDDIVTEAVEVGWLHVYTMVLRGRIEYNQTRIKCVFTHSSGTLIESDTAILTGDCQLYVLGICAVYMYMYTYVYYVHVHVCMYVCRMYMMCVHVSS